MHVRDNRLLLAMYYKELLFFLNLFKISEKVQKKLKNQKNRIGKDVIFGSSQVMSPSNRALFITFVGWVNIFTLGSVLIPLSLCPLSG